MNKEQLYEAIGEVNDSYIHEALYSHKKAMSPWVKWGSVAASLAAVLLIAFMGISGRFDPTELPTLGCLEATEETAFGTRYVYSVDHEPYNIYVCGKVIDEERIGKKLEDVTVTAGWITAPSQTPADETLRGEIYAIKDISPDVAVALWFLDKGDALTTTHYYVILNPDADLSPMAEYVIADPISDPKEE